MDGRVPQPQQCGWKRKLEEVEAQLRALPTPRRCVPTRLDTAKPIPTPSARFPIGRSAQQQQAKRARAKRSKPLDLSWALRQCHNLLCTVLMRNMYSWPFHQPVDPVALNLPDYFARVTHPMDLGTIKERLESGYYVNEDDFAGDVRRVWQSAFEYCRAGSDIYVMAKTLSGIFEDDFTKLKKRIDEMERTTMHDETLRELNNSIQRLHRELKRIKQSDQHMTQARKKKLSEAINKLPIDCMNEIVRIIKKDESYLASNESDTIEIEIDALNPSTLHHLERYVNTQVKKQRATAGPKNAKPVARRQISNQDRITEIEEQLKELEKQKNGQTQSSSSQTAAINPPVRRKPDDESESSESEGSGDDEDEEDESSSTSDSESESCSSDWDVPDQPKEDAPPDASVEPSHLNVQSSTAASSI